ncbi:MULTISPECIES: hypothetical protein [unclassified Microbispora]|uniref:hypothetical protein n=1 Tax=unclassified Microbispora TaxID=2614687 RepID=UPI001F0EB82C|nr:MULTISPECIES: hypothetical protein [unclassified Microbispora]
MMPSGSLLVARTRRPGHSARSRSASTAAGSATCSQLSSTSSVSRDARAATSRATGSASPPGPPGMAGTARTGTRPVSRRPSAVRAACTTSAASLTGASSTSHTPPGTREAIASADSTASLVLPAPPGPSSVTRRSAARSAPILPTSSSRPTKLVSRALRLPRRAARGGACATGEVPCSTPASPWNAGVRPGGGRVSSREGSPLSIARWSSASAGEGSAPSRSANTDRASSKAASASTRRPAP